MNGAVVGAIVAKKRREIINAFRKAGATTPDNSKTLKELELHDSILFEIQKMKGVIVEASQDKFYLDEAAEAKATKFRRLLVIFLILILIAVILFI